MSKKSNPLKDKLDQLEKEENFFKENNLKPHEYVRVINTPEGGITFNNTWNEKQKLPPEIVKKMNLIITSFSSDEQAASYLKEID